MGQVSEKHIRQGRFVWGTCDFNAYRKTACVPHPFFKASANQHFVVTHCLSQDQQFISLYALPLFGFNSMISLARKRVK
jgi:hypothetical protein